MQCYNCGIEITEQELLCESCKSSRKIVPLLYDQHKTHRALKLTPFAIRLIEAVLLLIIVVSVLDAYGFLQFTKFQPYGVLVKETPVQTSAIEVAPWQFKGYIINPQAHYKIRGRVLTFGRFYFTSGADLSPIDITLGWGPVSDQKVLDIISFSHSPRMVFLSVDGNSTYSYEELNRNFSNNHIIPANDEVRKTLFRVGKGDIINIAGYLITVSSPNFSWGTSLSREDTGNGACELVWADNVTIE